jgi:hypothetical protein
MRYRELAKIRADGPCRLSHPIQQLSLADLNWARIDQNFKLCAADVEAGDWV